MWSRWSPLLPRTLRTSLALRGRARACARVRAPCVWGGHVGSNMGMPGGGAPRVPRLRVRLLRAQHAPEKPSARGGLHDDRGAHAPRVARAIPPLQLAPHRPRPQLLQLELNQCAPRGPPPAEALDEDSGLDLHELLLACLVVARGRLPLLLPHLAARVPHGRRCRTHRG
eukprot:990930-Prymnesium_polylepis.2